MYDMDDQNREMNNHTAAILTVGAVVILVAALLVFLGAGRLGLGNSLMGKPSPEAGNEVGASGEQTAAGEQGSPGQQTVSGQQTAPGQQTVSGQQTAPGQQTASGQQTAPGQLGQGDGNTVGTPVQGDGNAAGMPVQGAAAGQASADWNGSGAPAGAAAGSVGSVEEGQNGTQTSNAIQGGNAFRDQTVQVESISLTGDRTFMLQCDTMQLSAQIEPQNAAHAFLTWTSSDEAVAKVSQTGQVTSVGGGNAVITATASNGVSVDYPLSVSGTQKRMKLTIRTARTESDRIGEEWAYSFEVNGNDVTGDEVIVVTLGETMTFYSAATEYLENHDLGTVNGSYTVSRDSFKNGFEVTQNFGVDENGENADGGWADITVIFTFANAT